MAAAGLFPYLGLLGAVSAGWLLAVEARVAVRRSAEGGDVSGFFADKIRAAKFYAKHFLAPTLGSLPAVKGGATILGFAAERF